MISVGVNGEGLNENDLLTSRSCIIAQSGAGKSYGVAVICEQLAKAGLGFCVIDTEGEYFSLKQEFELLWLGSEDSDVNLASVNFEELAIKVIKQGVPVIFDISDFKNDKELVSEWIAALYKAADQIRQPYLLIIEEADKYVPQRGNKLGVIGEVARRGRKRGLGLLVASQRPALIDKEILSQCNHQLIGRLTVETDLDSVRYFFNSRNDLKRLPDLMPGEFFMIGFKPEEKLLKFKQRVTKHTSVTPEVKHGLTPKIKELINGLSIGKGLGVKSLIDKQIARDIALKKSRKKYYLFGKRESVDSISLLYKPLIELSLRVLRKKLFQEEFVNFVAYLTPDLRVVDQSFNQLFDLSFMKQLSKLESNALIALLYHNARTVNDVMNSINLNEVEARKVLKGLQAKGFVSHKDWQGKSKTFSVTKEVVLPRVTSIGSDAIEASVSVNESFEPDIDLINQLIQSLDSKASIIGTKVIYYPFYKAVLKQEGVDRELYINGVTGKVS